MGHGCAPGRRSASASGGSWSRAGVQLPRSWSARQNRRQAAVPRGQAEPLPGRAGAGGGREGPFWLERRVVDERGVDERERKVVDEREQSVVDERERSCAIADRGRSHARRGHDAVRARDDGR